MLTIARQLDLKSGYPFWSVKNGLIQPFPSADEDLRCDVAVVGGGITGALIADELSSNGHSVVVVEERDVGWGSSAASTALLQYEIDTHLVDLAKQYGEHDAVLAYRACASAIPQLQAVAGRVRDVDFHRRHSLYYASKRRHRSHLADEFALRLKHGFEVEWLDRDPLRERYGIDAPGSRGRERSPKPRTGYRTLDHTSSTGRAFTSRWPTEVTASRTA